MGLRLLKVNKIWLLSAILFSFVFSSICLAEELVRHDMMVRLDPHEGLIDVEDRITLPMRFSYQKELPFLLHKNFEIYTVSDGFSVKAAEKNALKGIEGSINSADVDGPAKSYILSSKNGEPFPENPVFSISYKGKISHSMETTGSEYQRSFSETKGIISTEGSYLSGGTYWIPYIDASPMVFDLEVELPADRDVVSQGKRTIHEIRDGKRIVKWECPEPMDEIYFIEGNFIEYKKKSGKVTAYAFLRNEDQGIADKYIEATGVYLDMYSDLIGPYPYSKFALIENFWETGYGMPSFTLLGPKVIRFPFILQSSYPHEILHNWWGNSVFVDYGSGNWCEGITAYMADHMFKEMKGKGHEYRRDTLQKYLNYVRDGKDFPLKEFRARHSAATEAVGYGKSLMIFHMLRMRLGDELFIKCLQKFYDENIFKKASFDDMEKVFSRTANQNLKPFFTQWVDRLGAPEFKIDGYAYAYYNPEEGAYLKINIKQVQKGEAFKMNLPIAIHFEGEDEAQIHIKEIIHKVDSFELKGCKPIAKVDIDPSFDVFRRLHREEIPPTIGQTFGAKKALIILPDEKREEFASAWKTLAKAWSIGNEIEIKTESQVDSLPSDRAIWVFGQKNRWRPSKEQGLDEYKIFETGDAITIGKTEIPYEDNSFVISLRHPGNNDLVLTWLCADPPDALPGLSRKLPHYGKYSYLAFKGEEPANYLKGQWPLIKSPMTMIIKEGEEGALPSREPLAEPAALVDKAQLMTHLSFLTDDRLKGRGLGTPELDEAAAYIARMFKIFGLKPGADDGAYFQEWTDDNVGKDKKAALLKNVIGVIPGTDPVLKDEWVVIGAHYDHLGLGWPDVHAGDQGKIHNGADDNASGVACLIELARILGKKYKPAHTLAFIAFTGEEAGLRGSKYFMSKKPQIASMVNLDSVGRLDKRKLTVLGAGTAREWPFIVMGVGYTVGLEANAVSNSPQTGDQVSFWEAGVPAIHIFAGMHLDYHRPTDDIEKIDIAGMVKIVEFAKETLIHLANRKEPLDVKLDSAETTPGKASAKSPHGAAKGNERRVSLGTMPDFTYEGVGMRIAAIVPGGPAEKAGLKVNDIITGINEMEVKGAREMSGALRSCKAGDKITVHYTRNKKTESCNAVLVQR